MKSILAALTLFFASSVFAITVSSTIYGIVIYVPNKGQIVKKGEVLVQYKPTKIDMLIAAKKQEIAYAVENCKSSAADYDRYGKLVRDRNISPAYYEDVVDAYFKARYTKKKLEYELQGLESDKQDYTILAPCNCKVTELYLLQNSGAQQGYKVLEVEEVP